jgi:hypothetical protein
MTNKEVFSYLVTELKYWCQDRAEAELSGNKEDQFAALASVVALTRVVSGLLERMSAEEALDVGVDKEDLIELYTYATDRLTGKQHPVTALIGVACLEIASRRGEADFIESITDAFDKIDAHSEN